MLTADSASPSGAASSGVNPFQIGPAPLENLRKNEAVVKQIFGAHCECGAERMIITTSASPTVSPSGKGTLAGSKHGSTSLEHGIINPTPFKHKAKGEKRVIVRESMLKNIGKCVHQNLSNVAKEAAKQHQHSSNTFLPAPSPLKPSLSENNLSKCFSNDASDDILDFRLLVAQCSELTLTPPSGSKTSDSPNYSQSSFKALRQPDFSGFQLNRTSTISSSTSVSRRNRRARQLKRYNSTSSLESDSSSSNSSVPFGGPLGGSFSGTAGPSPNSQQQQQNQPNQQQSPSASSPSSSSSASCSTQARLNSMMPCDITIDEMASYFETLVHIPKKMSSMAEMMYI